MESHKDSDEDSKKTDWRIIFILFRSRGFSDKEICQLSYPKFKAYIEDINNPLFFPLMIPYLGGGEKDKKEKIESKEELLNIIADMNREFK